MQLNVIIASTLYTRGLNSRNIQYLRHLFDYMIDNRTEVNAKFTQRVESNLECVRDAVISMVSEL
jgi:hypothetical protein